MTQTAHLIRSSGNRATTGELLNASPSLAQLRGLDDETPIGPPRGLYLDLQPSGGTDGDAAATLRVDVGREYGGGQASRTFTLTRAGAWLACAGWGTVTVTIEDIGAAVVRYAWTTQQPPTTERLLLVERITVAGAARIPNGAVTLATATADPGWTWRTQIGGGLALDIPQPQLGFNDRTDVAGSLYVATVVPNVIAWTLRPL